MRFRGCLDQVNWLHDNLSHMITRNTQVDHVQLLIGHILKERSSVKISCTVLSDNDPPVMSDEIINHRVNLGGINQRIIL